MKRTKLLLGSAILSIALLGTGYAYWTDALTIDSTVKSGNFDIVMEESTAPIISPHVAQVGGTKITQPDTNRCVATLDFSNLYPGAQVTYPIRIKNNGSIPAVLESCTVNFNNNKLFNEMTFKVGETDKIAPGNLAEAIKTVLKGELKNTDSKDLVITATLNNVGNDLQNYENKDAKLDIRLNWSQFNFEDVKK